MAHIGEEFTFGLVSGISRFTQNHLPLHRGVDFFQHTKCPQPTLDCRFQSSATEISFFQKVVDIVFFEHFLFIKLSGLPGAQ